METKTIYCKCGQEMVVLPPFIDWEGCTLRWKCPKCGHEITERVSKENRLRSILKELSDHSGAVTLNPDWVWLQEIQHTRPDWAVALLDEHAELYSAR
jgi:PHP family Zn ribbon phosphoesterase